MLTTRFSLQDYPIWANALLIPVQFALVYALPGMGLSGDTNGEALGTGPSARFFVLVWAALILEFPAISLHAQLARYRGAPSGFSRLIWVLIFLRAVWLLVLSVLALDAVGVAIEHWTIQFFIPVYGIIYILFCFLVAGRSTPNPAAATRQDHTHTHSSANTPVAESTMVYLPGMRQAAIGALAAFWNLVLLTSLWNILEAELMAGEPLPQTRPLVIGLLGLLSFLIYVPARVPYLLVEQEGIGRGLQRLAWYAVFIANLVTPIAATYMRQ